MNHLYSNILIIYIYIYIILIIWIIYIDIKTLYNKYIYIYNILHNVLNIIYIFGIDVIYTIYIYH